MKWHGTQKKNAASTSIWDCNCPKFHDENCGNTRNLRSSTNNEGNVACEGRFHIEPDLSELSSRPSLASPNLSAVPSWHPFDPQTCSWTTNVPTAYQVSRRHSMDLIATKVAANREITWGRQKKQKTVPISTMRCEWWCTEASRRGATSIWWAVIWMMQESKPANSLE